MALRPSGSTIYLLNIDTGRQEALGHFPGMVFAPRFSPDGRKVAFSVETAGNTDVWVMDLRQPRHAAADHRPGNRHLAVASRPTAARSCSTPTAAARPSSM